VCISKNDFINATDEIGIAPKKLVFIPNSILSGELVKNKKNSEEGIKKSKEKRVLSVGRFIAPKRFDLLIDAFRLIKSELHLVGTGPLLEELQRNAPDNVKFHGEIEDFHGFDDYDIFCLISESEGMPMSAIEAMSCGLPLILSNVGGCSELINNNGFVVENDPEDIAAKVGICIAEIDSLSKNSRRLFDKSFNLYNNRNKYIQIYNDI
jgi:glycosyltransferase involved in cell wall biosynthesis